VRHCASAAVAALAVVFLAGSGSSAAPAPPSGAALAAIATPATPSPLASERIYFVMTDRYANGDPSNDTGGYGTLRSQNGFDPTSTAYWHGGDFKGLTGGCTDPARGLQRIKDLGFTAVWVTPPVVNQVSVGDSGGYHGYWGLDFTRIDPHLGTDADFGAFVSCAHRLGLKVIVDVVVNHTGDVVQLSGGTAYSDRAYRDCRGKPFDPARYAGTSRFPCLNAASMPHRPFVLNFLAHAKKPEWLNDPLNYHDRGDIDFGSCSQQCFEQGDFFGLDDLFTEKPNVEQGLARIFGDWVTRYKLDGFRVDTARHLNARFFKLWVPQILAAARAAGVRDFQIFGEVFDANALDLVPYVRNRGLPNLLDFPFQDAAAGYASGGSSAVAVRNRLDDDDYVRLPDGRAPASPTFLGNHDMGRAALQISQHGGGLSGDTLLRRTLLGYDLLYLLRGAPVVYYGDEVGMIGAGGDQQARQDMFPTRVGEWQTQPRLGGPPIGTGSSFDVATNPIEARLRELARLRDAYPELATGATIVRRASGKVLVVSRIDAEKRREVVIGFNSGDAPATVTVSTAAAGPWAPVYRTSAGVPGAERRITLAIPAQSAVAYASINPIAATMPAVPALSIAADDLTSYLRATARVTGSVPLSVAFALRRPGGSWQRLAADDSPPYRAFVDPARYPRGRPVYVVAIARGLDGSTSVSKVVTVIPRRG
jgi:glycosidase